MPGCCELFYWMTTVAPQLHLSLLRRFAKITPQKSNKKDSADLAQGVRCKTNLPLPMQQKNLLSSRGRTASYGRRTEYYSKGSRKIKKGEEDNLSAWSIEDQFPVEMPVAGHSEKIGMPREVSCVLAPSTPPPQPKGVKTQVSSGSGKTGPSPNREMIKRRKLTRKRFSEVSAVNVQYEATVTEEVPTTPPPIITPSKLSSYEAFVTELKKKKRAHSSNRIK